MLFLLLESTHFYSSAIQIVFFIFNIFSMEVYYWGMNNMLKIKVPNGYYFCTDAIEETFLEPFSEQLLKEP